MTVTKVIHTLNTNLIHGDHSYDMEPLLCLLERIKSTKNLRTAAIECNYSYRKAWDMLVKYEHLFGMPLVEKKRGKGTRVSELGSQLLNINKDNKHHLAAELSAVNAKTQPAIDKILAQVRPLKVIASDCETLNKLRQQLQIIDLQIDGSFQALAAYSKNKCDAAGFHIAANTNIDAELEPYRPYFDPKKDQFILLEKRQQGLISHTDRPVNSLQQIVEQRLVLVNRQTGSGTRLILDNLLKNHHIQPHQIQGYFHEEHTHLAVASLISSRQADVGLGIKSVADRLKLSFYPMTDEYYFLLFNALTPQLQKMLQLVNENLTRQIIDFNGLIKVLSNN